MKTEQEIKGRIKDLTSKQEDYVQVGWDDDIVDISLKIKELKWVLQPSKEKGGK